MNTCFQHLLNTGITTDLSLSEERTIRFINISLLFGLIFCFFCFIANLSLMGERESLLPLFFFFYLALVFITKNNTVLNGLSYSHFLLR